MNTGTFSGSRVIISRQNSISGSRSPQRLDHLLQIEDAFAERHFGQQEAIRV